MLLGRSRHASCQDLHGCRSLPNGTVFIPPTTVVIPPNGTNTTIPDMPNGTAWFHTNQTVPADTVPGGITTNTSQDGSPIVVVPAQHSTDGHGASPLISVGPPKGDTLHHSQCAVDRFSSGVVVLGISLFRLLKVYSFRPAEYLFQHLLLFCRCMRQLAAAHCTYD
jgi:hypothetical protein